LPFSLIQQLALKTEAAHFVSLLVEMSGDGPQQLPNPKIIGFLCVLCLHCVDRRSNQL